MENNMQDNFPTTTESNSARKRRLAAEFNAANKPVSTKGIQGLTGEERSELNALSKEVFGASSRWQKLVNNGYPKMYTEKVTEYVPGEKEGDEGKTQEKEVPLKNPNGTYMFYVTRHTVETVKEYMLQRKEQLDMIKAAIKKQQDEAKAKKEQEQLALKVNEELQGSAL
ncbi:unnamed protein product [Sphagnum balticum]